MTFTLRRAVREGTTMATAIRITTGNAYRAEEVTRALARHGLR